MFLKRPYYWKQVKPVQATDSRNLCLWRTTTVFLEQAINQQSLAWTVMSVALWSFLFGYPKLVRFLHKNQHAERKFWYFVKRSNDEPVKIGHFQSQFSRSYISFLKMIFLINIKLGEQLLLTTFFNPTHSYKSLSSEYVPNFWRLCLKLSDKISKNLFSLLIGK